MKKINAWLGRYAELRLLHRCCLALLALGSIVATSANAAVGTCSARGGTFTAVGGWTVYSVPNPVNNSLLASINLQMNVDFSNMISGSTTAYESVLTTAQNVDFTGYNSVTAALPLKSVAGVGATVIFVGMYDTSTPRWVNEWAPAEGLVFTPSANKFLSTAYIPTKQIPYGLYKTSLNARFQYQLSVTDAKDGLK